MVDQREVAAVQGNTFYQRLRSAKQQHELKFALLSLLTGSLILTASAKIAIPFYPVPMTLQSVVALLLGATLGPRLGGATVALYLFEGAVGFPVFAQGGGVSYLFGATGGYLLGFLVGAVVVGALSSRGWDRRFATMTLAMSLGTALIYVPGILWLGFVVGWDKPLLSLGVAPFVYSEAVKIALGAMLLPTMRQWIRA